MSEFKLTYFNGKGRAELTRLIFAQSGTKFHDERIEGVDWPKIKPTMPFGKVPILRHGDRVIFQSLVIARYAARHCGLVGRSEMDGFHCDMFVHILNDVHDTLYGVLFEPDAVAKEAKKAAAKESTKTTLLQLCDLIKGGFVLGDVMSYADLMILDAEDWFSLILPEVALPPKMKAVADKVRMDPNIAAYLAKST